MLHLDEGILSALLDGELAGAEQRDVEAHLRGCAECRDRLAELKGFMQEADQLVTALDEVPTKAAPGQPVRRRGNVRVLAWAASIVAAVGLGFAGRSLLLNDQLQSPAVASGEHGGNLAPEAQPPAPDSPAPVTQERAAINSVGDLAESDQASTGDSAPRRRSDSVRTIPAEVMPTDRLAREQLEPRSSPTNELSVRGGRTDEAATYVDGVPVTPGTRGSGFRSDSTRIRSNALEAASSDSALAKSPVRLNDVAAGAAESAQSGIVALSPPASKQADAQPQAPAQPTQQLREEARSYARLLGQVEPARVITMEEAVRVLGGSIRLVDSLTPVRVELTGADSTVRVVYVTAGVEVWLDQRRNRSQDTGARYRAAPAVGKLAGAYNQLYWNDLRGFYLTLTGALPMAELELLQARIR